MVPPKANAEFVCAMEDVLEVYTRPYDPERPQVCLDECSKQLVAETRSPLPAEPGQAERFDCEYERRGTANLFMLFEPLAGKRHVEVTERRTAVDFARVVRDLADVHYPAAKKIVLVMDNLNTHRPTRCTRRLHPRRLVGWWIGWKSTIPQAWQLAGHGRNRIERLGDAVPGPEDSQCRNANQRSCRLAGPAQRRRQHRGLALQNRRCTD